MEEVSSHNEWFALFFPQMRLEWPRIDLHPRTVCSPKMPGMRPKIPRLEIKERNTRAQDRLPPAHSAQEVPSIIRVSWLKSRPHHLQERAEPEVAAATDTNCRVGLSSPHAPPRSLGGSSD